MNAIEIFHFDDDRPCFDDFSHDNGFRYWYARDLMQMLGYSSYSSFKKAINKAMAASAALNIDIGENFIQEKRHVGGTEVPDYRLSRFACYLTAMNGDPNKPEVASAQAYFITLAEAFKKSIRYAEDVERVYVRDEISQHEKTLSGVAHEAVVVEYQFFQNAGYRGLYNMNLRELKTRKGIPAARSALDFMGKEELAANLFRITQTEAKIRNENVYGQNELESSAYGVGRKVRDTMIEISGDRPEDLPIADDIRQVRSAIKQTHRGFARLDKAKPKLSGPDEGEDSQT